MLCRFLPADSLVCFCILNPHLSVKATEDLNLVVKYVAKPCESSERSFGNWRDRLYTFKQQTQQKLIESPKLASQVEDFAREHKVDAIWSVLEGQTLIRVTLDVAKRMNIPLHTMVWDVVEWWLQDNDIDKLSSLWVKHDFDQVIKMSRSCATASWTMSEAYESRYNVRCIPVISSLPRSLARPPSGALNKEHELTIGVAGQLYAENEWKRLLDGLDAVDWRINERSVRLKLIGKSESRIAGRNIDYLGYQPQEKVIELLSQMDLCFCPYPFSSSMKKVSQTSFPSKLVSYLASGRPTIVHAPDYASPAKYVERNAVGVVAKKEDFEDLIQTITTVVKDERRYSQMAQNAHVSFLRDFTHETMRANFINFLEMAQWQRQSADIC